jgi:hypothetical protein
MSPPLAALVLTLTGVVLAASTGALLAHLTYRNREGGRRG